MLNRFWPRVKARGARNIRGRGPGISGWNVGSREGSSISVTATVYPQRSGLSKPKRGERGRFRGGGWRGWVVTRCSLLRGGPGCARLSILGSSNERVRAHCVRGVARGSARLDPTRFAAPPGYLGRSISAKRAEWSIDAVTRFSAWLSATPRTSCSIVRSPTHIHVHGR